MNVFRAILLGLAILFMTAPAFAQSLTLPLEGLYRPGQFTPVRVTASQGPVTITGDNIVPVTINTPGPIDQIVPLLILDHPPSRLTLKTQTKDVSFDLPFLALTGDQNLIAYTGDMLDIARSLDPGAIALRVDPALLGVPVALQSVDLVLLDSPDALSESLLSLGIPLAVRAHARPDDRWPWQTRDNLFILHHELAGPASAAPLLSVPAWTPQPSPRFRTQVFLGATLLAIATLAISLLPARRSLWLVATLAGASALALAMWQLQRPPIYRMTGDIHILHDDLVQTDRYTFLASPIQTSATFPVDALTFPIIPIENAYLDWGLAPQFRFMLAPHQRITFLSRIVRPGTVTDITDAARSPMRALARDTYRDAVIVGEIPAETPDTFPAVVMRRVR